MEYHIYIVLCVVPATRPDRRKENDFDLLRIWLLQYKYHVDARRLLCFPGLGYPSLHAAAAAAGPVANVSSVPLLILKFHRLHLLTDEVLFQKPTCHKLVARG